MPADHDGGAPEAEDASDNICALLSGLGLSALVPAFEEEELTPKLLRDIDAGLPDALAECMAELGVAPTDAARIKEALRVPPPSPTGEAAPPAADADRRRPSPSRSCGRRACRPTRRRRRTRW